MFGVVCDRFALTPIQRDATQCAQTQQHVRECSLVIYLRWWESVGRHSLTCQTRKCHFFRPFWGLKIAFFDLSLQRLAKPDHSMHVPTLLSKLYQHAYTESSQHRLCRTWTKRRKIDLSLRGAVRRISTHVHAKCMSAGTLLITTVPRERAAFCQYSEGLLPKPRDFCPKVGKRCRE